MGRGCMEARRTKGVKPVHGGVVAFATPQSGRHVVEKDGGVVYTGTPENAKFYPQAVPR